jgi:hypothetical protein
MQIEIHGVQINDNKHARAASNGMAGQGMETKKMTVRTMTRQVKEQTEVVTPSSVQLLFQVGSIGKTCKPFSLFHFCK